MRRRVSSLKDALEMSAGLIFITYALCPTPAKDRRQRHNGVGAPSADSARMPNSLRPMKGFGLQGPPQGPAGRYRLPGRRLSNQLPLLPAEGYTYAANGEAVSTEGPVGS
jgi:hypothetical protein